MKRLRISTFVLPMFLAVILVSPGSPIRSAQKASPDKSPDKTKTIYIADFELDAQNVQPDEGPVDAAAFCTATVPFGAPPGTARAIRRSRRSTSWILCPTAS